MKDSRRFYDSFAALLHLAKVAAVWLFMLCAYLFCTDGSIRMLFGLFPALERHRDLGVFIGVFPGLVIWILALQPVMEWQKNLGLEAEREEAQLEKQKRKQKRDTDRAREKEG